MDTINPKHNYWRKVWDSIGGPLCKGILSDQKFLGSPFSMAIRIISTLNGLHEITFIIDSVYDQLVKKLSKFDEENLQIAQLFNHYLQIDMHEAQEIADILKTENFVIIDR